MTIQGRTPSRPLILEDDPPGQSRFRRVQAGVPPIGRPLPGMPLDTDDLDDEISPRSRGSRFGSDRFGEPKSPWWRPSGTLGRVLLGMAILAVLGGVTAGVLVFKTYLGRDSRFRIAGTDNIEAIGLTQVSREEMLPVFGEDVGRNIFFIPLNERRKQLEAIPWVEHASVMRLLPDQIRVSIVERQPVAFVRQGQQIGLVDKSGVLLTMPPAMMAQHNYSFPVVTGLEPTDPLPLRRSRMAVYERLLAELDSNNQNISQQISEIDLTDPQDARVLLPEQGMDILAHFGDDRFLDRYQRYKTHIAEWRQQYPKLTAVDLRYENQVVLEMAPGTSAVAASPVATSLDGTNPQPAPTTPPAAESASAQSPPPSPAKPAAAKLDTAKTSPGKPAAAKSVAGIKTENADKPARTDKQPKPEVKRAAVKEPAAGKSKPATKKTPEMLAVEQRKARERAQKERAAREKAEKAKTEKAKTEKDKKRAAQQHTAQNVNRPKPSTHSAAATAQGQ